ATAGGLELLGQLSHDGLLLTENLCVRHLEFTSVEIESNFSDADATKKPFSHSKHAKTAQRISFRCGCILGRNDGWRHLLSLNTPDSIPSRAGRVKPDFPKISRNFEKRPAERRQRNS